MQILTDIIAYILAMSYHLLKKLELRFHYAISFIIVPRVQNAMEELGVVFHFTETNTKSEEKEVRRKTKYKELLHMTVHKKKEFFCSLATDFALSMGESWLRGEWEMADKDLPELSRRSFRDKKHMMFFNPWNKFLYYVYFNLVNLQTERRAWLVGKKHYDTGNSLFESFLDPYMTYTCGYWKNATNIDEAQIDKMDLIAKKLNLKKGMRLLDIGCGWGGMCKYFAEKYEVECVGITISKEGAKYAKEMCKGLPVEIKLIDYRSLEGKFDRIISVGMFEHVGQKNYRTYFETVHRCLKDDGIFLLHCIGRCHVTTPSVDLFSHKYIFPNSSLPHHTDIANSVTGLFVIEDWHNFGPDYATTMEHWYKRFQKNWPKIADQYDEKVFKVFKIWMRMAVGLFTSRGMQLFQVVLSKDGLDPVYRAAR